MFSASVGRCRFGYLAILYITLQAFIVGLIIGSLSSQSWVISNADKEVTYSMKSYECYDGYYDYYDCPDKTFNSKIFKGGVIVCYHGCGQTGSYIKISEDICESYNEDDSDNIDTVCITMENLYIAGYYKILLDVLTIIFITLRFFFMVCRCRNWMCFKASYVCSVISCFFYYAGSVLWFVTTSASFSNCDKKFPNNGESLILCAIDRPVIMVTLMVIYPFIVGSYITIGIKANKSRLAQEALQNENIPHQPIAMVQINQPVNGNPNYIINPVVNNADINGLGPHYQNHQNIPPNVYNNLAPQQFIYYHINNPGIPPDIQNYNFIIPPDAHGNNPQVYNPVPNNGQNVNPAIIYNPQVGNNGNDSIDSDFSK